MPESSTYGVSAVRGSLRHLLRHELPAPVRQQRTFLSAAASRPVKSKRPQVLKFPPSRYMYSKTVARVSMPDPFLRNPNSRNGVSHGPRFPGSPGRGTLDTSRGESESCRNESIRSAEHTSELQSLMRI